MSRFGECADAGIAELELYGITGNCELTGSGHVRISWRNKDGVERSYVTSFTSSDHRSALNCKLAIRRQLRNDGMLTFSTKEVRVKQSLARALESPRQHGTDLADGLKGLTELVFEMIDRVAFLEASIEMLAKQNINVNVNLRGLEHVTRTEATPPPKPVDTYTIDEPVFSPKAKVQREVYRCFPKHGTLETSILVAKFGDKQKVSNALKLMKDRGLVVNVAKGLWRLA